MIRKEAKRLHWLEFSLLANEKSLAHAVFLKQEQGDFSQDLSLKESCLKQIFPYRSLFYGKQTHGKEVLSTEEASPGQECDGFFTQKKEEALLIRHADCQAAILFDPQTNLLCTIHSGWRGLVQNIYREGIQKIKKRGARSENILVGIAPSLGPCCAEFIHYKTEFPEHFLDYQIKPNHFNLWAIGESLLKAEGILSHHIEVMSLCTKCNPIDCYSYRRGDAKKRHGTVAMLTKLP